MVRRQAVDEVGLLDLQFRKYFEDVDFCLRMARGGWRVMMNGETFGYHLEQRASRNLFSKDAFVHLQSYARWLAKWGFDPARHAAPAIDRPRRAA
jgi:GT2 family glycosyltransferase